MTDEFNKIKVDLQVAVLEMNLITESNNSNNEFYVHVSLHRKNFFIIKPTRYTNFIKMFWHETLHVSDQDGLEVPPWSCSKAVYKSA